MKQKIISFTTSEGHTYSLTVCEASVRMNLTRTLLMEEAQAHQNLKTSKKTKSNPTGDAISEQVDSIIRFFLYPSLVASVIHQTGFESWPISFEEFSELPDQLEVSWEEATFELNPHWKPDLEMSEEERSELRKKAMSFISELEESSEDETTLT